MRSANASFLGIISLLSLSSANAQTSHPLVFDTPRTLMRFGIGLEVSYDYGDHRSYMFDHFPARCYTYGESTHGWNISMSNAFLEFYQLRGFSHRSLCLALVSGIRFNPETGQRLASYVLIDRRLFSPSNIFVKVGISDELPLSVPDCFRRGLPYSDCEWNYDPITGKRFHVDAPLPISRLTYWSAPCRNAEFQRNRLCSYSWTAKEIGTLIETFLNANRPALATRCAWSEITSNIRPERKGFLGVSHPDVELYKECTFHYYDEAKIAANFGATLFDFSDEFPKGFGYALYAEPAYGGAGPGISAALIKAALTGRKPPSQLQPEQLRRVWSTGRHSP
jgi:hypothetical protein